MKKIRLGVSACLLGQNVRYDGGHKADLFIIKTLSRHFSLIPLCPESEAGLGVPREAIHLVRARTGELRLKTVSSEKDVTPIMNRWLQLKMTALAGQRVRGFILKARSPSCAVRPDIPIYGEAGNVESLTSGLFVQGVREFFPFAPMIEESDLRDEFRWASFLEELATYDRFCRLAEDGFDLKTIERFHRDHRLLIMSRDARLLVSLDQLMEKLKKNWMPGMERVYYTRLKAAFRSHPTLKKQLNCLKTLVQELSDYLSAEEIRLIEPQLRDFQKGNIPLAIPLTTISNWVKKYKLEEFFEDAYLFPPHWARSIVRPDKREQKD